MDRARSTNGEKRYVFRILVENQKERGHWEEKDADWWIILK
jgi:hypothetical protein